VAEILVAIIVDFFLNTLTGFALVLGIKVRPYLDPIGEHTISKVTAKNGLGWVDQ
jgi:hypothetical protein